MWSDDMVHYIMYIDIGKYTSYYKPWQLFRDCCCDSFDAVEFHNMKRVLFIFVRTFQGLSSKVAPHDASDSFETIHRVLPSQRQVAVDNAFCLDSDGAMLSSENGHLLNL